MWWLVCLIVSERHCCVYLAAPSAHDCLVVFTVDPQDEAERKEQHLAIIADHLGFSWTGTPQDKDKWIPSTKMVLEFQFLSFFRAGTTTGLRRGKDQPDKE